MLPQHLVCKYELNCEYCNITLARNKALWWWSDKIETCRSVLKCFKCFMWNYMRIRWLINWNGLELISLHSCWYNSFCHCGKCSLSLFFIPNRTHSYIICSCFCVLHFSLVLQKCLQTQKPVGRAGLLLAIFGLKFCTVPINLQVSYLRANYY